MVLYNVTMNVDVNIEIDWLQWMKETHVKDVLNTGCFYENKIFKLMSQEDNGSTYSFQYFAKDMKNVQSYQENYGARLQMDVVTRYGDKVMSFRTILESVD